MNIAPISELPFTSGFFSDMSLYSKEDGVKPNSMMYNLIPMDEHIFSRPAFISKAEFILDQGEIILHTGVENSRIIIVSNKKLRVFSSIYVLENTTIFTAESSYASGVHYLNTYVIVTEKSGFYVISSPKNGALVVTPTASFTAPVPYGTGDKVIGARAISALGNSLFIGNLTITKTSPLSTIYEESYILFSKLSTTASQLPTLPFKIDDNTFEITYPFALAAQGSLVELEWFSNQLLASFSSGESYVLSMVPSILIPVNARRISTKLGAISEGCTVVLENDAYVLAQETVAVIQQSGIAQRIGDHIRSFIRDRNVTPISSIVSTSLQSIMWVISSKICTRSTNQILLFNYKYYTASVLGIVAPYTIQSILPQPESNDIIVLISYGQTVYFTLLDESAGQDSFESIQLPITHAICSKATVEDRKGSGTSNIDPYFLTLLISCPNELTIYSSKKTYNGVEKNSDRWEQVSQPIQLELRNKGFKGTTTYATTYPMSQSSAGCFIAIEIISKDRFTIECGVIEQSPTW